MAERMGGLERSGCGGVIAALGCVSATRLPVSTPMKRGLRSEPAQLLQGIVGSHEAITDISTSDECLNPK